MYIHIKCMSYAQSYAIIKLSWMQPYLEINSIVPKISVCRIESYLLELKIGEQNIGVLLVGTYNECAHSNVLHKSEETHDQLMKFTAITRWKWLLFANSLLRPNSPDTAINGMMWKYFAVIEIVEVCNVNLRPFINARQYLSTQKA